ncbi:hypothetical protein RQP46_002449 [Phenoliferia psychrophenolica]
MFKGVNAKKATDLVDLTQVLRDPAAYALGHLANLGLGAELSAHAYDPVQSLLAVGTTGGALFVFGGPGVQLRWDLGRALKIKHLAFRCGSGFLAVVGMFTPDAKDTLSVYDLARLEKGKPVRDSSLSMRSVVTCIETSASHSFIFLGGKDGTVDVFDLDRGVLAAGARVPNLWLAQEEILRRSGVQDAPNRRHIPVCTDIKAHPTDVNLLLIAYEGGVSLWNIASRHAERNWEFVVPPGASGGGNDPEELLFSERRSGVTCLAWRPDGLMFAVGHEDGCISFASVLDENLIGMRTLERADVNKTTEEDLFGWTAQGEPGHRKPAGREPIFRLAWSGFPTETLYDKWAGSPVMPSSPVAVSSPSPTTPAFNSASTFGTGRGAPEEKTHLNGGTVLTIMGGLLPQDPTGIHLFEFLAYIPPSASTTSPSTGNLTSAVRNALKDSIQPVQHNLYPTATPPEDFLLLPRNSPYGGLAFDPTAILITTGEDPSIPVLAAPHSARGMEAWSFPPTNTRQPHALQLPPALGWSGTGTCASSRVFTLPTLSYQRLLHQYGSITNATSHLPLRGGKATSLPRPNRGAPNNPGSPQPRILVTLNVDLSIHFWDISSSVLRGDEMGQIVDDFPRRLAHLDVDLRAVLRDPVSRELEASRILRERPWELELDKVDLATETLELAVSLSTGEVIVLRLVYGQREQSAYAAELELDSVTSDANSAITGALNELDLEQAEPSPPSPTSAKEEKPSRRISLVSRRKSLSTKSSAPSSATISEPPADFQDQHVDLSLYRIPNPTIDGFRPAAAFKMPPSRRTTLAMSDVGFLAASSEAALIIVDMRGPEVLLFETGAGTDRKGKVKGDSSNISSLTWAICAIGEDHDRSPRLLAVQDSGLVRAFELSQVAGTWLLSSKVLSFTHENAAGAFATFVLSHLGALASASPANLAHALAQQSRVGDEATKGQLANIWVAVTDKVVSVYFNIDGPRTASFEGAGFVEANVVVRNGCPVLVVVGRNKNITILSLPDLNQVQRFTIPAELHSDVGTISLSRDGDFVQHLDPFTIRLHTIFDISRPAFPPALTVFRPEIPVPPQLDAITNVTSTFTNLFGGKRVYGAAEIEAILGGPNRPPPKQRTVMVPVGDVDNTASIVSRTTEALQERGEYLGNLQERLGSMATEAAQFAKDASKTAKQQAAQATLKNSIAGYFSKFG